MVFDRSWDNRPGVERVMGVCGPEEPERFLELVAAAEQAMVDSGDPAVEVLAGGQPRISHLLRQVPASRWPQDVTLPKRPRAHGYVAPTLPVRHLPPPS